MKCLDLFSGIGGFALGLEWAGMTTVAFCEQDEFCRRVLARHWPDVPCYPDVRYLAENGSAVDADVVCGGDPCPSRSKARGGRPSSHPDLAGYFLAVVGRVRPRWVVRENVFAPDALDFAAVLDMLGYEVASVGFDSADFTAQSRRRQFLVGCPAGYRADFLGTLLDASSDVGFGSTGGDAKAPVASCLTAHPSRLAAEDNYCFEPGRGLRLLSAEECESLTGLPRGWTAGLALGRRRAMCGNAVTVPVVSNIGRAMMAAEA